VVPGAGRRRPCLPTASRGGRRGPAAVDARLADRLKSQGVNRCLFAIAVRDVPQAGYAKWQELAEAIRHVRSLGYEVYRYDQYRDAFRKGSSPHAGFQLNTEAWPDMIVRQPNGKMVQAFGPDSGKRPRAT
jgi:hypothetical protein